MIIDATDFIYTSMLNGVFETYCDICISYIDDKQKIKVAQELGRQKSHGQKVRAKNGMKSLPKLKQITFVMGCYDELQNNLLRQLKRFLGDSIDYGKSVDELSDVIRDEKEKVKAVMVDMMATGE